MKIDSGFLMRSLMEVVGVEELLRRSLSVAYLVMMKVYIILEIATTFYEFVSVYYELIL